MSLRTPSLLSSFWPALLVCCAALAPALDAPSAILAMPQPHDPGTMGGCGGCAVLIAADQALTLAEALPDGATDEVPILVGGRRIVATVIKRGAATGAVLLRLDRSATVDVVPATCADSSRAGVGDAAWTCGNSFGVLEQDNAPALSRGTISGLYAIPADTPPVRGRGGRLLSSYRGAVFETDAAVNDGNQGGALLDGGGHLLGLVSLGLARERRLGTAIPIHLICADLGLPAPTIAPTRAADPTVDGLARHAAVIAPAVVLVYCERPNGLGNPKGAPRPDPITEDTPAYERERLERAWDHYYHDQQILYTDQPITAVVIDAAKGLLLTAASNLHGGAIRGRVLLDGLAAVDCDVVAVYRPLDLALLRAARALPVQSAPLAERAALACGDPIAILGRHRPGTAWTMTTGVVSATDRRMEQSEFAYHQTDALANYGNLGGPVIGLDGTVVGLLTMLGPNASWPWLINSGVALFVDSATIAAVLPQLERGESQEAPRTTGLGVNMQWNDDAKALEIKRLVV
ncbi:MAG: serine protease, partial [Planctomycetes bacterium]|nr:serine protease [Planctomycetota bacterium]